LKFTKPVKNAKSFTKVSDTHPPCSGTDEMEFTPTNEVLDYRASQLHYLPPEKYSIVQSDQPRSLVEKIFADGRQKKYPPLPVKETHVVVSYSKAMKALTKENLLKAPLPTSVFPSYRTVKNIGELQHRKCDNCGKKNKCEILCDGPKCSKGYCLNCLGFKTIPKRLLHWNTEADNSTNSLALTKPPRYRPFFAKFCHPISEVDCPATSYIRFVEKTVQKRPRKAKAPPRTSPHSAPETELHKKRKKKSSLPPATPPAEATAAENTVQQAISAAQCWIRDNTSLVCLPLVTHLPIATPNPLGIHEILLTPNTPIKCPISRKFTHQNPKYKVKVCTVTSEISIQCLFGKCPSGSIKLDILNPLKSTPQQQPQPPRTPPEPAQRTPIHSLSNPPPNTTNAASSHTQANQKKRAKRTRSLSPDIPQTNRRNPRRQCRDPPCNSPFPRPCLSPCPSPCPADLPSPDLHTNPPVPQPLPTDTPPP
jgi:hypothetical protein